MKNILLITYFLVCGFLHSNAQVQNSNTEFFDVVQDNFHTLDTTTILDMSEVEYTPEFQDGNTEMNNFIQKNLVYPLEASENGIAGKVWVMFDVERNGTLSNCKIARSVAPILDNEALRIVKFMPNWAPGRNVKVKNVTIPVAFKLD
jgi:TonB family protein